MKQYIYKIEYYDMSNENEKIFYRLTVDKKIKTFNDVVYAQNVIAEREKLKGVFIVDYELIEKKRVK